MHTVRQSVTVLSLLVLPVVASGQNVPKQCGELPFTEAVLELHSDLFISDELAGFRERHNIQQLTPDTERAVVTDRAVCREVMKAAVAVINEQISPSTRTNRNQIDFAVFQYGPYYLVVTATKVPRRVDVAVQGYGVNLVFLAATLEFLGWILG